MKTLYLFLILLNGMVCYSQSDTIQLASSEKYTVFLVNGPTKSIQWYDKEDEIFGILSQEVNDNPTVSKVVVDVNITNDLIGLIKYNREFIVYALYEVSENKRKFIVNNKLLGLSYGRTAYYELIDAKTLWVNDWSDHRNSSVTVYHENGEVETFKSPAPRLPYDSNKN